MDIVPKNEFISLNTLEKYIEKYPEDAEKWLEFIQAPVEDQPTLRRYARDVDTNNELYKSNSDLYNLASEVPVEHYNDGCLFCKKSWASTDGVPTTTLICGHKFHTLCSMIDQYTGDTSRCIVEDCDISTWDYVRKIVRSNEKRKEKTENILLDSYKKRPDFKNQIKELKGCVSQVSKFHSKVSSMISSAKKDFIHKHLYTINQMQNDINENIKTIKESEHMHNYKQSVRNYRKTASHIFRKYHLSFRELRERGILRTSWRLRWVLERHRNGFRYYKMGIRIYPGKREWKDTLDNEEELEIQEEQENI